MKSLFSSLSGWAKSLCFLAIKLYAWHWVSKIHAGSQTSWTMNSNKFNTLKGHILVIKKVVETNPLASPYQYGYWLNVCYSYVITTAGDCTNSLLEVMNWLALLIGSEVKTIIKSYLFGVSNQCLYRPPNFSTRIYRDSGSRRKVRQSFT